MSEHNAILLNKDDGQPVYIPRQHIQAVIGAHDGDGAYIVLSATTFRVRGKAQKIAEAVFYGLIVDIRGEVEFNAP